MTKLQALQEKYFDKLEENGIEFYNFEDIGNNQTEAVLKDEYSVSPREMFEYLGTPEWLIEWGMELIEEEIEEIKNKNQFMKKFNDLVEKKRKEYLYMREQTGLAVNYN